jgi:hypothetical protein
MALVIRGRSHWFHVVASAALVSGCRAISADRAASAREPDARNDSASGPATQHSLTSSTASDAFWCYNAAGCIKYARGCYESARECNEARAVTVNAKKTVWASSGCGDLVVCRRVREIWCTRGVPIGHDAPYDWCYEAELACVSDWGGTTVRATGIEYYCRRRGR